MATTIVSNPTPIQKYQAAQTASPALQKATGYKGPAVSVASTPALINTSKASEANYNNNVNTLNTTNNALKQTSSNNPSVVDMLNLNGMPSDYNSRAKMAAGMGIQNYTGTGAQNTQLLNYIRNGTTGETGSKGGAGNLGTGNKTITTATDITNTTDPNAVTTTDTSGAGTGAGAGGTGTGDGSYILKDSAGNEYTFPKGMDKTSAQLFIKMIDESNKAVEAAKESLATAKATKDNDPAMQHAADTIEHDYDILIQQTKDKQAALMANFNSQLWRTGMIQASDMSTNATAAIVSKFQTALDDLNFKKQDAIFKSNQAYKDGDVKAFNDATQALMNVEKEQNTVIKDHFTEINDIKKQNAAEIKQANADARNATLDSMKEATFSADNVARAIQGLSADKAQAVIEDYANKMGIDPSHLQSAVSVASAKITKEDLANARTEALINKASQGTPLTIAEKKEVAISNLNNVFVPGATLKDGTPLVDDSGFITPVAFKQAVKDLPEGLTKKDFITEFGSMLYTDNLKAYGLTPVEQKLITGIIQ